MRSGRSDIVYGVKKNTITIFVRYLKINSSRGGRTPQVRKIFFVEEIQNLLQDELRENFLTGARLAISKTV